MNGGRDFFILTWISCYCEKHENKLEGRRKGCNEHLFMISADLTNLKIGYGEHYVVAVTAANQRCIQQIGMKK